MLIGLGFSVPKKGCFRITSNDTKRYCIKNLGNKTLWSGYVSKYLCIRRSLMIKLQDANRGYVWKD